MPLTDSEASELSAAIQRVTSQPARDLMSWVRDHPGFVGVRVDYPSGGRIIVSTTSDKDTLVADGLPLDGLPDPTIVDFRVMPHSLDELSEMLKPEWERFSAEAEEEGFEYTANFDAVSYQFDLKPVSSDERAMTLLTDWVTQLELPVPNLIHVSEPETFTLTQGSGSDFCNEENVHARCGGIAQLGNHALTVNAELESGCTPGWVVSSRVDGSLGYLTAGHCLFNRAEDYVIDTEFVVNYTGNGLSTPLTLSASSLVDDENSFRVDQPGGSDSAFLQLQPNEQTGVIPSTALLNQVIEGPRRNSILVTQTASSPETENPLEFELAQGDMVCHQGGSSLRLGFPVSCGTIESLGNWNVLTGIDLNFASFDTCSGNSGGPVWTFDDEGNYVAAGILSGTTSSVGTFYDTNGNILDEREDGATLCTEGSSRFVGLGIALNDANADFVSLDVDDAAVHRAALSFYVNLLNRYPTAAEIPSAGTCQARVEQVASEAVVAYAATTPLTEVIADRVVADLMETLFNSTPTDAQTDLLAASVTSGDESEWRGNLLSLGEDLIEIDGPFGERFEFDGELGMPPLCDASHVGVALGPDFSGQREVSRFDIEIGELSVLKRLNSRHDEHFLTFTVPEDSNGRYFLDMQGCGPNRWGPSHDVTVIGPDGTNPQATGHAGQTFRMVNQNCSDHGLILDQPGTWNIHMAAESSYGFGSYNFILIGSESEERNIDVGDEIEGVLGTPFAEHRFTFDIDEPGQYVFDRGRCSPWGRDHRIEIFKPDGDPLFSTPRRCSDTNLNLDQEGEWELRLYSINTSNDDYTFQIREQ